MLLGWDLQDSWDGPLVGVEGMPDHLCNVLVDENNANVIPVQKLPESVFDLIDGGVLLNHQEIRVAVLVKLPYAAQKETRHRVLVPNHRD